MTLLLLLSLLPAPSLPTCLTWHPALRDIHRVECGDKGMACERNASGACGPFRALGGRYGNPPCWALERWPWLATMVAMGHLRYWRRHCGERVFEAYHEGWVGCYGEGWGYTLSLGAEYVPRYTYTGDRD